MFGLPKSELIEFGDAENTASADTQNDSDDSQMTKDEAHSDLPSVDVWAADTVISFLDLMAIANVNDRRKTLLALVMGKKEEDIATLLKIADSYLFLMQKYYEAIAPDDEPGMAAIKVYAGKSAAMKAWLGI